MEILDITGVLPTGVKPYNKRASKPTVIVIHHSETRDDVTPELIARYHVYINGWPGIGYHYLVYPNGRINQVNDIMTLSYHAGDGTDSPLNTNRFGVGVCLVGDFTQYPPPEEQLKAARELIAYLGLPFIPHKEAYNAVTTCPGDTWDDWKGELVTKEGKMGIGSYQFQGGATAWARQHVKASGARMIKQIQPDLTDLGWFSGDIIGRLWWNNEPDKALVWEGAAGADKWWVMAKDRIARCPQVRLWEGPNEVNVYNDGSGAWFRDGSAMLYRAFELRRIEILHANGLKAVSGCTSTGSWELSIYPYLYDVFKQTDYWEVHEYGMRTMTLDGWHLLRYRKVISQLKAAGVRVPPIIIGETGIDYSGNPTTDGWKAQGLTAAEYAAQLNAYLLECIKDPEVVCVTPFVWSPQGWPSFEMTEDVSGLYTNYVKNLQPPAPPPHEGLPTDETSTNPKILVQKCRWWLEEMQRQYEAGNLGYANRIRLALIQLMYRAENAL